MPQAIVKGRQEPWRGFVCGDAANGWVGYAESVQALWFFEMNWNNEGSALRFIAGIALFGLGIMQAAVMNLDGKLAQG